MGTSNLYKGPKGATLLPVDYAVESNEQSAITNEFENEDNPTQEESHENNEPCVSWKQAKRTFSNQIGKPNPEIGRIVKTYTKASGGYKHAAQTALSSKYIAVGIFTLFLGNPDAIRQRIEQNGIIFEGRSTKDIFNDIYNLLRKGSALREDAVADNALSQTFSELFESDLMSEQCLDLFTPNVLIFMVSHFIVNSIFYKLLNEISFGELIGNKDIADIIRLENDIRTFIDGLVSCRVSECLRDGVTPNEVKQLVNDLYEDCYKAMEGIT